MELVLTRVERSALEQAKAAEPRLRRWRRYQAVLLLADGEPPGRVATALGCAVSSVYHWAATWRRTGIAGLHEGDHGGARPVLDAAGEAVTQSVGAYQLEGLGVHLFERIEGDHFTILGLPLLPLLGCLRQHGLVDA